MATELPKTIAVGGGKGGAGRSTVSLGLARTLSAKGRRVLLVDADTVAPILHLWLGMDPVQPPRGTGIGDPTLHLHDFVRETPLPNLAMMSFAHSRGYPYVRPRLNAPSLIERLEALGFDTVILDLPSGHDPVSVSLFALSHFPLMVAQPDVAGVVGATQHMRAAMFHGLGFHPECYDIEEELLMLLRDQDLRMDRGTLEPPFLSALGRRIVRETRTQLTPALVLNLTRHPKGSALATALCLGWSRLLGIHPRLLGQIPYDDAYKSPDGRANRAPGKLEAAISDIARTIENCATFWDRHPRPVGAPSSPHGLLGLTAAVPQKVVSMRLRGVREAVEEGAMPLGPLLDERAREEILGAITRAEQELEPAEVPETRTPEPVHAAPTPAAPQIVQPPPLPPTPEPSPPKAVEIEALPEPEPEPAPDPEPEPPEPEAPAKPTKPTETPLEALFAPAAAKNDGEGLEDKAPDSIVELFAPTDERDKPKDTSKPPGESPGVFLQGVRRSTGMSMRELSLRTKIGIKYIQAIEGVDRKALPRPVYLRGYLREIAQVFKIDEAELIRRYFAYLGYP